MTQTPPPLLPHPIESWIGRLVFESGYPDPAITARLYDELDFQRAAQGYLCAIPHVSLGQWQHEHEQVFGAMNGDLVHYRALRDKLGLLTSNATTPHHRLPQPRPHRPGGARCPGGADSGHGARLLATIGR